MCANMCQRACLKVTGSKLPHVEVVVLHTEEFNEHCLFVSDWPLMRLPGARQLTSQHFSEVASGLMLKEQLSHEDVQHISLMPRTAGTPTSDPRLMTLM